MNMNKKFLLFITFISSIFCFKNNIFAKEKKFCEDYSKACLKCVYTRNLGFLSFFTDETYTVTVKSLGDSKFDIKESCESSYERNYPVRCGNDFPTHYLFLSDKNKNYLKCPDKAYAIPCKDCTTYFYDTLSFYQDADNKGIKMNLDNEKSENNNKSINSENEEQQNENNENGNNTENGDDSKNTGGKGDEKPNLEEWKGDCSKLNGKECSEQSVCKFVNGSCVDAVVAEDPCNENSVRSVVRFFGYLLLIAKFAIPFIVIGFAVFDLYKSIIDKDEKALKTKSRMIVFRIIAGVTIFFLPDLVRVGFNYIDRSGTNVNGYKTCADCLLEPSSCKLKERIYVDYTQRECISHNYQWDSQGCYTTND